MLIPILASASGISVFFHKCSCEGRIILTLFVEHKCHEEQISSCCESKSDYINFSDADDACGCKTDHLTIKVDELFTTSDALVINSNHDFLAIQQLLDNSSASFLANRIVDVKNLYLPTNSPPIKPAGRVLINLIHQSKTPDFIS